MSKKRNQEFREEFIKYVNGYFNVPNYLSDIVQPILKSSVWDVLTAVWRKTVGHQSWESRISITYLEKMTGLSRPTVIRSLEKLADGNLIIIDKQEIGIGKRGGKGKKEDLMKKYGGQSSLIQINIEAVKILYWLEKAAVKNLYWYQLKIFTGMGLKPVKILYPLKTNIKNNKNRGNLHIPEEKQNEESQTEGAKVLRDFLDKIGKGLNRNSENVSLFDTKEQEDESGKNDSVSKETSEKGQP